jgi:hypothetical protein
MLHDQMLYDRLPIDENEDALRKRQRFGIVEAFDALREEEAQGSGAFWNFGDWVPEWEAGVPPGSTSSTVHRLTYRLAQMSGFRPVVEEKVGKAASIPEEAAEYARATAWRKFSHEFVVEEGLIRSLKDPTNERSEHAEALWRVGQLFAGEPVAPWPAEALERAGAAKCTYYFSYYKHLAMAAAALAEGAAEGAVLSGRPNRPAPFDYLAELAPWKEMIEAGLSTFAENPEPARSDCHAWSAHPALGFFQFVAGVTSVEPGWRRASICPQPGSLRRFDARIAHPDGELRVRYEDGGLEVDTPVPAVLRWRGKEDELAPGRHRL